MRGRVHISIRRGRHAVAGDREERSAGVRYQYHLAQKLVVVIGYYGYKTPDLPISAELCHVTDT